MDKVCSGCGNTHNSIQAKFCKLCGTILEDKSTSNNLNECMNKDCHYINDGDATHCERCGSKTRFHVDGRLEPRPPF